MDTIVAKSNVESEFQEIDSKGGWPLLYQQIRNECLNYDFTYLEARKSQNKNLNRYRDVSPYDHSRVVLSKGPCDYINANLVTMEKAHRRYILTQGPLPQTTGHFWLMVWEQNCKAVLMLNRIIEKNQVKCHQYWPLGLQPGVDDVLELTDVGLKVQFVSENEAAYYITRILRLTEMESGNSREIIHFHYTTWPDFGVPESPTAFLNFLLAVRESGALDQNVGPPVVHCSAGIGRSGTFCLVDSCLVLIQENGIDSVNVREVLLEMRRFRMGLIQTPDQLRFSYWAIIEGARNYSKGGSIVSTVIPRFLLQNWRCRGTKNEIESNRLHGLQQAEVKEEDRQFTFIQANDCTEIELNAITANHTHVENMSHNNKEEEDDDEPPPLPPPRGESLNRCPAKETDIASNDNCVQETREHPPDKPLPYEPPSLPPDRPLPSEPQNSSDEGSCHSSPPSSPDYTTANERDGNVRQRIRAERKERMTQQVREMKRKQQAAESWQQMKRSLFQPLALGIGVGVLLIGGAIAYSYFSSRV